MRRLFALSLAAAVSLSWLLSAQQARPVILTRLTWFDRTGHRLNGIGPVADHGNLELSPDGTQVAVAVTDPSRSTRDIWIYDTKTGERTQFTSEPSDENWLVWSGDGRHVIGNSFGTEQQNLFEASSTSSTSRSLLLSENEAAWPVSLSRDGKFLLYVVNGERTSNDIWVLPLDGKRRPYPFMNSTASENWAAFSPDGKWVAFSSTEGGGPEVYVSPFPANGQKWRVSADGGMQARWRRDGKEIFYLAPDKKLMAAALTVSRSEISVKGYEPLFTVNFPYGAYHAFDVTADGQRFLVNTLVVNPGAPGAVASLR